MAVRFAAPEPNEKKDRALPPVLDRRMELVGAIGLEPTTPTMSRWCSNQLSYAPEFVFEGGIVAGPYGQFPELRGHR